MSQTLRVRGASLFLSFILLTQGLSLPAVGATHRMRMNVHFGDTRVEGTSSLVQGNKKIALCSLALAGLAASWLPTLGEIVLGGGLFGYYWLQALWMQPIVFEDESNGKEEQILGDPWLGLTWKVRNVLLGAKVKFQFGDSQSFKVPHYIDLYFSEGAHDSLTGSRTLLKAVAFYKKPGAPEEVSIDLSETQVRF